jgi:ATP/maltotriose-dependent transcriptional regulator MalT
MRAMAETLSVDTFDTFGALLRFLRRRAGLKQRELAARVGYSEAHISRLEGGQRRADPAALAALFVPALGLDRQTEVVARLLALAERARTPLTAGALAAAHGIPLPAPCLVARPDVHGALRALLSADRIVVVCGLPGAGKTTLVATAARDWAAHGRVCWVTATKAIASAPEILVRRLAAALSGAPAHDSAAGGLGGAAAHDRAAGSVAAALDGAADPLPLDRQLDLLTPALAAAPVLLCVDDAHLLRDAGETLAAVAHLSAHGGLRVLLASRERLPLPVGAPLRLGGLAPDQAVELAARLDPDMPVHLAERLSARTDGNPMLLRLALAQSRQPGSDRERLVDRLESDPEVGAHLIDTALGGLSRPAADLTDLLAVFRHGVDLHDEALVARVQGWQPGFDMPAAAAELRHRQLLDHPTAAVLHPLIRDHRYARMAADPTRRRWLHRIAAGCYDSANEPLEAAWHFSRAGDPAPAADVLTSQVNTLIGRGQSLPAADLAARLLDQIRPDGDAQLVRRLLVVRGDLLVNTVRADEADAAYREALTHEMPAPVRTLVVLRLAESLLERHRPTEALALCADAAGTIGPREALLLARLNAVQAWSKLQLSEFAEAQPLARRALEYAAPWWLIAPDLAGEVVARAEWTLGVVLRLDSHPDAAAHLNRAAAVARSAHLHHLAARALLNLGALRWEAGDMTAALAVFAEAEASARATADSHGLARALYNMAVARTQLGELAAAVDTFTEVRALRQRLGDTQGVLNTQIGLANTLCLLGRTDEALTALSEVIEADWAEPLPRVHALDTHCVVLLAAGEPERAVHAVQRGLELASRHVPAMLTQLEMHLALGQLILGQPDLAELLLDGDPRPHGYEAELDTWYLRAALAYARDDEPTLTRTVGDLSGWIAARDIPLPAATPDRLLAAYARREPLSRLPRLIWCCGDPDLQGPSG